MRVPNIREHWTAKNNLFASRTVRVFGTDLKVSVYRDTSRNDIDQNKIIVIIHNKHGDPLSFWFKSMKYELSDDGWEEEYNRFGRSYLRAIDTHVELVRLATEECFLTFALSRCSIKRY